MRLFIFYFLLIATIIYPMENDPFSHYSNWSAMQKKSYYEKQIPQVSEPDNAATLIDSTLYQRIHSTKRTHQSADEPDEAYFQAECPNFATCKKKIKTQYDIKKQIEKHQKTCFSQFTDWIIKKPTYLYNVQVFCPLSIAKEALRLGITCCQYKPTKHGVNLGIRQRSNLQLKKHLQKHHPTISSEKYDLDKYWTYQGYYSDTKSPNKNIKEYTMAANDEILPNEPCPCFLCEYQRDELKNQSNKSDYIDLTQDDQEELT